MLLFLGGASSSDKQVLVVVVASDWSDDDGVGDEELLSDVIFCTRLILTSSFCVDVRHVFIDC